MNNIFGTKDKEQIGKLVLELQNNSGLSQSKFARARKLSGADISNLKNETWKKNPQLISGEKWIRLARLAGYQPNSDMVWHTAETSLKKYVFNQLEACRKYGFTGILSDNAGIGKTHALKEYSRTHGRVFYVDCSNARTRGRLIHRLADVVGADCAGCTVDDTLEHVIFVLSVMQQPLVVLDEAGDLDDRAILEIKRMYNNLEGSCGFYMVGADGLQRKIERGVAGGKQGFVETFSRFGKKFARHSPKDLQKRTPFMVQTAREILVANGVSNKEAQDKLIKPMIEDGLKDLRTIRREFVKMRIRQHQNDGAS